MKAKVIIKGQCCSKPQDYFFEGEMPQIAVEIMKLLMMVDLPDGHGFDEMNVKFIKEE